MFEVHAIIVTFNRCKLLEECIMALLKQSYSLKRIFIIDNGSTDETKNFMRQFENHSLIEYIRLDINLGGSFGFSEGIKRASTKFDGLIWCLDDDAIPKYNALEKLIVNFKDDAIAVASSVYNLQNQIQLIHRGFFNIKLLKQIPLDIKSYTLTTITEIGYASFVGLLLRAEAIKKIGLPQSDFFIWFDDIEFSIRLRKLGKIYVVPDSAIIHKDNSSMNTRLTYQNYWRMYYDIRNRILIAKLHGNMCSILLFIIFIFNRKIVGILLYDENKINRMKILFRGLFDGIKGKRGERRGLFDRNNKK